MSDEERIDSGAEGASLGSEGSMETGNVVPSSDSHDDSNGFDASSVSDLSISPLADSSPVYFNKIKFPATIADAYPGCSTSSYSDICDYVYVGWYFESVRPSLFNIYPYYTSPSLASKILNSPNSSFNSSKFYYFIGTVSPDSDQWVIDSTTNFPQFHSLSSTTFKSRVAIDSVQPLFYGVTDTGGSYPTETIFTILSITIFIAIVYACFRIFINPFWRRIKR